MTSTVDLGDVYVCAFPFTSGQGARTRPVLVLMDLGPDCLVCRITSVPHHGVLDLPMTNWQEAGLEKPSTGEQGIRSAVTGGIRGSATTFLALRSTAM